MAERIGSLRVERHLDRIVLSEQVRPSIGNLIATAAIAFFFGYCTLGVLQWHDPALRWILGVLAIGYGYAKYRDESTAHTAGHNDIVLRLDQRALELPILPPRLAPVIVLVDDILKVEIVERGREGAANYQSVVLEANGAPEVVAAFSWPGQAQSLSEFLSAELKRMGARFFV